MKPSEKTIKYWANRDKNSYVLGTVEQEKKTIHEIADQVKKLKGVTGCKVTADQGLDIQLADGEVVDIVLVKKTNTLSIIATKTS